TEAVSGEVVAGEAGGRRPRMILDHAELIAGAADAVTNPRHLAPRVPGAADRAAVAGPRVAPAGHQLDRTALDELLGAEVEDGQLVVVRPGAAAVTEEEAVGGIVVPADLAPALCQYRDLQVDPLVDREVRAEAPIARRVDERWWPRVGLAECRCRGGVLRADLFQAVGRCGANQTYRIVFDDFFQA